jgi:hypothetical protein
MSSIQESSPPNEPAAVKQPETDASPTTKARSLKRAGISLNVALQLLLCLVLFCLANYFGYRHWVKRDLSPNAKYSLSDSTKGRLRTLSKDVEITVVFMRDSPIMPEVRALVEEFRDAKKSRIKTSEIDPTRDLERAEQLKVKHKLTLKGNGILVRANQNIRFIMEEELVIKGLNRDRENPSVHFRGEDALISAITGLVDGKPRKFYFIAGKGATTQSGSELAYVLLADLGKQQNFEVLPINLTEVESIPDDASGLVLTGLKYDLNDHEMQLLTGYWNQKRAALLILLDPSGETPRLRQFLQGNGVTPRHDRVLHAESTSTGPKKQFGVQTYFLAESTISRPFTEVSAVFSGQSQSLALDTDSSALKARHIVVTPLIDAADRFWGEIDYAAELPVVDEADTKPPVHLAASVERGAVSDARLRVDSARMVVVGNASMLDPATRLGVHQDFISTCMNWMINREDIGGATPKAVNVFRIYLTEEQRKQIFWVTCLLMPGAILCLGLLIWTYRRA